MKRKVLGIGLVLALIGTMVGGLTAPVKEAQANPGTIWVNTTGWWHDGGAFNASGTPIQDAVNNATGGDVICVKDANYNENVDVGKRLTIRPENESANCIVNASNPSDHVFYVTTDYVNITDFTVQNATGDYSGIYLNAANHCNISGNDVTNNAYGIYLASSSNNNLTGNDASNNTNTGIYLESSSNNTLTGNTASNNGYSIQLRFSNNNNLTSNTALNNNNCDIYIAYSSNNTLTGNTASNNSNYGIFLWSSSNNKLTSNTASNNNYGIYLVFSSNNNNITSNNASNNTNNGIYLEQSSSNNLTGNTAYNNTCGIYLYSSSNSNNLTSNNAYNNTCGIYLNSSSSNNLTSNNASNNAYYGIWLNSSSSNNLTSNNAWNNDYYGILLDSSSNNNTITSNNASSNDCGIELDSSSNNTIYNNYFNNTNNAWDNGNNIWNTTKTAGTNIIGGPYLGGNYWSDYSGSDTSHDGLGDTLVPYNSTGNIMTGGDYLPLVLVIYATIEGTVYEANASVLTDADVVLLCAGSEVANTTTNASGYYNLTVDATCNYTVNVTKAGITTYSEKQANITAPEQNITVDFTGMDAPYRKAPDVLYCIKCSNLWLYGAWYPEGFALDAKRVSDVLYAWTHPT